MTSKCMSWRQSYTMTSKSSRWRQKVRHGNKNTSWLQKYVTSKMRSKKTVRHDVKNTSRFQSYTMRSKIRHDVQILVMTSKSTPWRQKVRHDVKKYVMMSKIRPKNPLYLTVWTDSKWVGFSICSKMGHFSAQMRFYAGYFLSRCEIIFLVFWRLIYVLIGGRGPLLSNLLLRTSIRSWLL